MTRLAILIASIAAVAWAAVTWVVWHPVSVRFVDPFAEPWGHRVG
jgi:hypothetical protein